MGRKGEGRTLDTQPLFKSQFSFLSAYAMDHSTALGLCFPHLLKENLAWSLLLPLAQAVSVRECRVHCLAAQGASWGWLPIMTVSQGWRLCNRQIYQEGMTVCSAAEQSIIRLSQHQQKYRINVIREEMEKNAASVKASSGSPWFPEH